MDSIVEIFRIGPGPSSSHTMGPRFAALAMQARYPAAVRFRVTLYGSLAATGRGHLTDVAVTEALRPAITEFVWLPGQWLPAHPNALRIEAFAGDGHGLGDSTFFSIGGGAIVEEGADEAAAPPVYEFEKMSDILAWTKRNGKDLAAYVFEREPAAASRLAEVWAAMRRSIESGLKVEGTLPGGLKLPRKAAAFFRKAGTNRAAAGAGPAFPPGGSRDRTLLFAYALAVSEQNAACGIVVTAPTCGAAGVLPAVLEYLRDERRFKDEEILRALATAGLVGVLIKTNASISGAEVGCQGEIGSACAMAAAAAAQLLGGTPEQVEYAAEMGLEHHLGLTCDPVGGMVQIPCIERNTMAAARALDCAEYALNSDGVHRVSFDDVVRTMAETGKDLLRAYRETALGGLAKHFQDALGKGS